MFSGKIIILIMNYLINSKWLFLSHLMLRKSHSHQGPHILHDGVHHTFPSDLVVCIIYESQELLRFAFCIPLLASSEANGNTNWLGWGRSHGAQGLHRTSHALNWHQIWISNQRLHLINPGTQLNIKR